MIDRERAAQAIEGLESVARALSDEVPDAHRAFRRAAAVLSSYDPATLRPAGEGFGEELAISYLLPESERVIDARGRPAWTLNAAVRRRTLRRLGDREAILHALEANPERPDDPIQRAFETLVRGDRLELRTLDPEELAGLLTAREWLAGILPDLPPADVLRRHAGLHRLLAPLRQLADDTFRDREEVLDALRDYVGVLPGGSKLKRFARRLATGKSFAIGHVAPLGAHDVINPHFADFLAGAGETYAARGYDMLLSVTPAENEAAAYRDLASRRSVDGLIVHAPLASDERIALLRDVGLPLVSHGRAGDGGEGYSWLDVNNRRCFERATRFLLDLGHRRIALLNGLEHMAFAARRRDGYEAALRAAGIEPDPALMFSADMIEPYGHEAMARLLSAPRAPTALLCASILPAMGALRAVRERGLEVGREVSIITFDDQLSFLPNPTGEAPLFTSVRSSIREAGRRTAEMLLALIDGAEGPLQELWEAELVIGSSTGPVA